MRAIHFLKCDINLIIVAVLVMISQLPPWVTSADAANPQSAVVEAVEGSAYIVGPEDAERQPLSHGNIVPAWKTVGTDENSQLLLEWDGGFLTSVGSASTLFVSTREIQQGTLTDIQLIQGILRASSFGGDGKDSKPYALTTPVAAIEPTALDTDVDFIAEVYEPAVTVITVLKGSVRVKNLTAEGSEEVTVKSCHSVFVEEGKPVSNAAAVPPDALEKLIASTTIAGTELAEVQVCGLATVEREPLPAPTPPPDYAYVEDEYVDYYYPYDEIEVYPPTVAAGPMIIVLPGIGKWYLPYEMYHRWGFGPGLIRLYVSAVLYQNALYYDSYYWNRLAVLQREYYNVLYPAQFAGNTILISQTLRHLDFVRIRQNLLARRMQNLQARVAGLEKALAGRGGLRAPVLTALYNSLNSPRNISVARSFRKGVESRLRIQEQLAGNVSDELFDMRRRMARARNPQERLQLRDQMYQLRNVISEGRLPIPKKDREIRNLLGQIPKTRDPEQLNTIQKQLSRRLGQPKVMAEPAVVDPKRLEGLARKLERTVPPEARRHIDRRLQDLQKTVRQREEIESTQREIDRVVSQAAKTKNEAQRAELLRKVPDLVKPDRAQFKGALGDLREQQLLHSQIIGKPEAAKQDDLHRRIRDFTEKQADKVRLPVGRPTGEMRRRVEGPPRADEAARKRAEELKKQSDAARRKAEQMLKQKETGLPRVDRREELERARTKERLQRSREAEEALRRSQEKAKQAERLRKEQEGSLQRSRQAEEAARRAQEKAKQAEQRKASEAERLRREKERSSRDAEIQRRRLDAVQKQKEEQARQQRLREQQTEQTRRRAEERAKAQQQERQLRLQQEQRRKAEERARNLQRQEQIRRQAEQARSRELERAKAQQREQEVQRRRMEQQGAQQQQMREQQRRQQQMDAQRAQQRQMQEQRMRQMQRPQQRGGQPRMQDLRRRTIPVQPGLPGMPGPPVR